MKNFILTSIKNIRKSLNSERAIFFIGSGVSINSGLPSWTQLIKIFANELDIEADNISMDDYLKIPQYHYNERGAKEYYNILMQVFNKKYKPNFIHDLIFELNPWHIITTNFDDLLERKLLENGALYHIIKENRDVSYGSSNRMLIKMHGDMSSFNVVLKEEDYLSYEKNFQLIDNVVRTILLSYSTVFIGFSAEDPNFKLLYQWVKNELGDHLNESYLIDTSKEYNKIIFDYYKARGIKILYVKELIKEDCDVSSFFNKISKGTQYDTFPEENGQLLFSFLSYVKDGYGTTPHDMLDVIYNKLKYFKDFNILLPDMIVRALGNDIIYDYKEKNSLYAKPKTKIYEFLISIFTTPFAWRSMIKTSKREVVFIIEMLKKANIKLICFDYNNKEIKFLIHNSKKPSKSTPNAVLDAILDAILSFDTEVLKKIASEHSYLSPGIDNGLYELEAAYCYYKVNDYITAFTILKKLSSSSFQKNNYIVFCICEFNKKLLSYAIKWTHSKEEIRELWDEIDAISLEEILSKIPPQQRHIASILKRILDFDFANEYSVDISEQYQKVVQQKRQIEQGGASFSDALYNAYRATTDFFLFTTMNFLMVDSYSNCTRVYKSFVQTAFASYSIQPDPEQPFLKGNHTYKLNKFDFMTLYFVTKHYDFSEMLNLVENNKIKKMSVESDVVEKLLEAMNNLSKIEPSLVTSSAPLFNAFFLLSLIHSDKSVFSQALGITILYSIRHTWQYEYISKILVSYYNNNRGAIDLESLFAASDKLIKDLVVQNALPADWRNFHVLLTNIFSIARQSNNFFPSEFTAISVLVALVKKRLQNSDFEGYEILAKVIIPSYGLCDENTKVEILSILNKTIENHDDSNIQQCINIILKACFSDVPQSIKWVEVIIEYINSLKSTPNPDVRTSIANIAILHDIDKISLPSNIIEKICLIDNFARFLLNSEDFDFSKFDFEWINYVKGKKIESLICKKTFQKIVKERLISRFSESNSDSQMVVIINALFDSLASHC